MKIEYFGLPKIFHFFDKTIFILYSNIAMRFLFFELTKLL